MCNHMAGAWTQALDLPEERAPVFHSLTKYLSALHLGATAVKPGIKSVVSRSVSYLPLEEKSQGQAVNTANGLGWAWLGRPPPRGERRSPCLCRGGVGGWDAVLTRGPAQRGAPALQVRHHPARACHSIFYGHFFGL